MDLIDIRVEKEQRLIFSRKESVPTILTRVLRLRLAFLKRLFEYSAEALMNFEPFRGLIGSLSDGLSGSPPLALDVLAE